MSNGQTERQNQNIKKILKNYVDIYGTDWDDHLNIALAAYNSSVHETTGFSPFFLLYGQDFNYNMDIMYNDLESNYTGNHAGYASDLRRKLQESYTIVRSSGLKEQERHKRIYDKKVHGSPYKDGDLVYLHSPAMPKGTCPKFYKPWIGPYKIETKICDGVYRISKGTQRKIVNFDRLKPYQGSKEPDNPIWDKRKNLIASELPLVRRCCTRIFNNTRLRNRLISPPAVNRQTVFTRTGRPKTSSIHLEFPIFLKQLFMFKILFHCL